MFNQFYVFILAFASALCFLYDNEVKIETLDVINVLAAARFLRIDALVNRLVLLN